MKKQTVLKKENILLGLEPIHETDAVKKAGQLLVESGYVDEAYIEGMLAREKIVSTYIGNGVAIPHGVNESAKHIKRSGIVVLQFPKSIKYHDNDCYLVIGIAGKENEHMKILANIAEALSEEDEAKKLWKTDDIDFLYRVFSEGDDA